MQRLKERIKEILVYAGIMLVLYLFYRSIWVITLLLPCMIFYRKIHRKEQIIKRKAVLNTQFKDLMDCLAASLGAGYSIPNALNECLGEIKTMHGEDSPMYEEVTIMLNQIHMGMTPEEVFADFSNRTNIADIETFSAVYSIASHSGGDMVEIVRKTANDIGAKIDTKNEIEVVISAKKMEMRIMSLIPIGIIVFMDLTTEGLLDPLYGNAAGVLIMTICLALYIAALILGHKITNIEV